MPLCPRGTRPDGRELERADVRHVDFSRAILNRALPRLCMGGEGALRLARSSRAPDSTARSSRAPRSERGSRAPRSTTRSSRAPRSTARSSRAPRSDVPPGRAASGREPPDASLYGAATLQGASLEARSFRAPSSTRAQLQGASLIQPTSRARRSKRIVWLRHSRSTLAPVPRRLMSRKDQPPLTADTSTLKKSIAERFPKAKLRRRTGSRRAIQ